MRQMYLCAWLAFAFAPADALGQSPPMTEADALARLSPESPRVRAILATVDVARADVIAAGRWPNPRVTFNREAVAGVAENMTMVTQTLPVTGRRGLEVKAASALADAAAKRADDGVRRARADLRLAFAGLVSAQTRERELSASRDHLGQLVDVLSRRESAGDAAAFDRLRAERELVEVETELARAAGDRVLAQAVLAGFFAGHVDPGSIVASDQGRGPRSAVPEIDALFDRAEGSRGEVLALVRERDAAAFAERAAERRTVPEPELVAGAKSSNVGQGDVGGVVAVHATVPLFDRNRAERAAAAARARLATERLDALRLSLRADLAALRALVISRRETADAYRTRAVEGATAIERIAQVSYDAGERTILELLDAYRVGTSARVRQAELDAEVRGAEVELEYVSGWEMP